MRSKDVRCLMLDIFFGFLFLNHVIRMAVFLVFLACAAA